MRRTHDGFMKGGGGKNLVYGLHRSDISLFTRLRTNGEGGRRVGEGFEGGWGNKSQAHLLVSALFSPRLSSPSSSSNSTLNATDESAARGVGEKMRADRTAGVGGGRQGG